MGKSNKLSKIINFCLVIIVSIVLFGCDKITPVKLTTPEVTINKNIVSWTGDSNSLKYEIDINGVCEFINNDYHNYILNEGETFKIRSIGDGTKFLNSDWSKTVEFSKVNNPPVNKTLGELISTEYEALKNGTQTNHTKWTFSGEVIGLKCNLSPSYNNYTVRVIIDVDGVLIGIINGQVNSNFPSDIDGLCVGGTIKVVGTISENDQLSLDYNTAEIVFYKPEISWEKSGETLTDNDVNFFMLNDTHGAFLDSNDGVSIGRVDTLMDSMENKNGEYIKIHNGDALQGSYVSSTTYGKPIIESLNAMEFDCFVLGNHEFDWGIDKISAYADGNMSNGEANFPFLGANIYYKGSSNRPEWIDEYTIVDYDGVKVGIIGVIGENQESSILTSAIKGYEFVDSLPIISRLSDKLRNELYCDVVVVATHSYDENWNNQVASLPEKSRVDAIFAAHTHQYINEKITRSDGKDICVVQNTHKNTTIASVSLHLDDNNEYESYSRTFYNPSTYDISDEIINIINSYADVINEANTSIGYTRTNIYKQELGAYAVDAMLNYSYNNTDFSDVDVAIINTGGVRATISSGDITKADVFEVFPFNNSVVLVNLSGSLIKELYSENSKYLYIDVCKPINEYYLDDDTIYQLAIIDYVFEGTRYHQFDNLTEDDYIYTGVIMRDILIEYLDEKY